MAFAAAFSALVIAVVLSIQELNPPPKDQFDPSGLLQILLAFPIGTIAAGALTQGEMSGKVLASRLANLTTIICSLATLCVSSLPWLVSEEWQSRAWLTIIGILAFVSFASLGALIMRIAVERLFVTDFEQSAVDKDEVLI